MAQTKHNNSLTLPCLFICCPRCHNSIGFWSHRCCALTVKNELNRSSNHYRIHYHCFLGCGLSVCNFGGVGGNFVCVCDTAEYIPGAVYAGNVSCTPPGQCVINVFMVIIKATWLMFGKNHRLGKKR